MDSAHEPDPGLAGPEPTGTTPPHRGRNILWISVAVILAFLAGFGWQYVRASSIQSALTRTEQDLAVERIRVQLAQAALEAQSGEFESARGQMSGLFDRIQATRDQLPPAVRRVTDDMLAVRDEIITGLSRGNPETAGTLFGLLDRLRHAVEGTPPPAATDGP